MTPLDPRTQAAYSQLADWLAQRQRGGLRVLGICGSQGSGKSTLAQFLVRQLMRAHGLTAVAISLDDFYLPRADRVALAARVHPLLATRGVPGTHDAARGHDCLRALKAGTHVDVPHFSKAHDDRLSRVDRIGTVDLVLFEGWCVGVPPQNQDELLEPVNALERDDDADGRWRAHVNAQLAGPYAAWFAECDAMVFLQVPSWTEVRTWRAQQERETAAQNQGRSLLIEDAALDRFLQHYQRLTLHALRVMPVRADAVLELDVRHAVAQPRFR